MLKHRKAMLAQLEVSTEKSVVTVETSKKEKVQESDPVKLEPLKQSNQEKLKSGLVFIENEINEVVSTTVEVKKDDSTKLVETNLVNEVVESQEDSASKGNKKKKALSNV